MIYTRSTHKRTLHSLRWTSVVCLQGAGCRSQSRGRALYRDASRATYVLGSPPSRVGDLELEGGVHFKRDGHVRIIMYGQTGDRERDRQTYIQAYIHTGREIERHKQREKKTQTERPI